MGWFDWLRGKGGNRGDRAGPSLDIREMCGFWSEGDLALCINDPWLPDGYAKPVKGEIYRVVKVDDVPAREAPHLKAIWLYFPKIGMHRAFRADNFRKVVQQKDQAEGKETAPDWLQRVRRLERT